MYRWHFKEDIFLLDISKFMVIAFRDITFGSFCGFINGDQWEIDFRLVFLFVHLN